MAEALRKPKDRSQTVEDNKITDLDAFLKEEEQKVFGTPKTEPVAEQRQTLDEFLAQEQQRLSEPQEDKSGSGFTTALSEIGSGALLGYDAPVAAALIKGASKFMEGDPYGKISFDTLRDEIAMQRSKERSENPGATKLGQIASIASNIMAPVGPLAKGVSTVLETVPVLKGAGLVRGAAKGAVQGAVGGAVANPLETEGEEGLQLKERGMNAYMGGLIGAPIGGVIGGIQKQLVRGKPSAITEPVPDRAAVVERAAEDLDVPLAPGMASENQQVRYAADIIRQSPTIAGRGFAKAYDETYKAIQKQAGNVTQGARFDDKVKVGDELKDALAMKFIERYEPIKKLYGDAANDLTKIKTEPKVLNRFTQRLGKQAAQDPAITGTLNGRSLVEAYAKAIDEAPNLEALRRLQSSAKKIAMGGDPTNIAISNLLVKPIENLIQRQTVRAAIEATGRDAIGKSLAKQTLKDIKTANAAYKPFIELVQTLGSRAKLKTDSFGDMMKALSKDASPDSIPSEKIADALFNSKDQALVKLVEKEFPDVFEVLRQAKLGELVDSAMSTPPGQINKQIDVKKLLNKIDKQPEWVVNMLLPGQGSKLQSLNTLIRAMPEAVGPSGTPRGMMFAESAASAFARPLVEMGSAFSANAVANNQLPNPAQYIKPRYIPQRLGGTAAAIKSSASSPSKRTKVFGYYSDELVPLEAYAIEPYVEGISNDPGLSNLEKSRLIYLARKQKRKPWDR